jgi:Stress responsive A/B Barrel Domain
MYRRVALLHVDPATTDADRDAFERELGDVGGRVPAVTHSHLGRHLEGTVGGGDYTWDLAFADADSCPSWGDQLRIGGHATLFDRMVKRVDCVQFPSTEVAIVDPDMRDLVKRTLFLEVSKDASADQVDRFDHVLMGMPRYIPAIRNWACHRADDLAPTGPRRWTHVWEQEYADISGLRVDYMMSPYHWGFVDGWFDSESPHHIVEQGVAHVFCGSDRSILAWT